MVSTKIRLIIFFAAEDGEALYSQYFLRLIYFYLYDVKLNREQWTRTNILAHFSIFFSSRGLHRNVVCLWSYHSSDSNYFAMALQGSSTSSLKYLCLYWPRKQIPYILVFDMAVSYSSFYSVFAIIKRHDGTIQPYFSCMWQSFHERGSSFIHSFILHIHSQMQVFSKLLLLQPLKQWFSFFYLFWFVWVWLRPFNTFKNY